MFQSFQLFSYFSYLLNGITKRCVRHEPARYASDIALICWLDLEANISVRVLSVVPAP